MNRSVYATVSLSTTKAAENDEQDQDQRLDSIGRGGGRAWISREDIDPVDRNEPDPGLSRAKWRQEVHDAEAVWSLLTEGDLAALEAHSVTLTDLIQTRYSLAPDEAKRQVASFIKDHQLFAL